LTCLIVAKPIGCIWILEKKELKPDGTVDEYKAFLVVKGFKQREKYRLLRHSFTSHENHIHKSTSPFSRRL
jgi:hypothetical protein